MYRVIRRAASPRTGTANAKLGWGEAMNLLFRKAVPLGELVLAVFDEAAQYSPDPREVSRLATKAVANMLRRARRTAIPSAFPTP